MTTYIYNKQSNTISEKATMPMPVFEKHNLQQNFTKEKEDYNQHIASLTDILLT